MIIIIFTISRFVTVVIFVAVVPQWPAADHHLLHTLSSVFILYAVTCHSFRRDCLFSLWAHSGLFINTPTQEVLFIRQRDRDRLGVRCRSTQRGDCVKPLEDAWGFALCQTTEEIIMFLELHSPTWETNDNDVDLGHIAFMLGTHRK